MKYEITLYTLEETTLGMSLNHGISAVLSLSFFKKNLFLCRYFETSIEHVLQMCWFLFYLEDHFLL